MTLVIASILAADFANLKESIQLMQDAKIDGFHIDIMDGNFVPNISFGSCVIESVLDIIDVPIDVHLMVNDIDSKAWLFDQFSSIASPIYYHYEACIDNMSLLEELEAKGIVPGIAFNPDIELNQVDPNVLNKIQHVLIMSVWPGFGGQKFIADTLKNVAYLKNKYNHIKIAIDGGINDSSGIAAVKSGADILISGSYLFSQKNICRIQEAISLLKC